MSTDKESAPATSEISTTEWLSLGHKIKGLLLKTLPLICQLYVYQKNEIFTIDVSATEMSADEMSTAEMLVLYNSDNVLNICTIMLKFRI